MAKSNPDYSRGYAAGRKRAKRDIDHLLQENARLREEKGLSRRDRMYIECLGTVLQHCNNWKVGDKPINDHEGFSKLAKLFMDKSIKILDR